ncbi:conserved hypothetical protein [Paecilomyces variotii No. 5]|uniref:Methyltransferase domain-containing protein n=1 Tax=Byssochlamys spectabilis (strain No. 5 / NBRC 109023) TaxID=1356009 RepID=V5FNA7_BYSSN|nr:conserved hypothetical protein [Paecilomyces variotii No. 5]
MAAELVNEPSIDHNPQLQSYYQSLESRIGYRLFLGGTRHFGYYESDTYWPFPITKALRSMEDKLAASLNLPPGAYILDAGCGVGHVAINLAKKYGFKVRGIDVVRHHLEKAQRNILRADLPESQVEVLKMDYHHLDNFTDESFDGIYTMETLVHATNPEAVLMGFYRVLRSGGHLSMFEYDHSPINDSNESMADSMHKINEIAAMPTNSRSLPGVFQRMLEDAGFTDIVIRDYSDNIRPMIRLFYIIAYIPFLLVSVLGLGRYFINTMAGVEAFRGHRHWRYVAISATKLGYAIEPMKNR